MAWMCDVKVILIPVKLLGDQTCQLVGGRQVDCRRNMLVSEQLVAQHHQVRLGVVAQQGVKHLEEG